MANVLSDEKKQQVIALGRLGWTLRRIQQATGVRRETASVYLKAAGIAIRPPGGWGRRAVPKPAKEVITDFGVGKPASEVSPERGATTAHPAPAWRLCRGKTGQRGDHRPGREVRAGACRASHPQSLRQCL